LGHDQLDILVFKTFSILWFVILVVILLVISSINRLALAVVVGVIVAGVVVSRVVVCLGSSQLLSSGSLGLGVEILNLGLTKDTIYTYQLTDVTVTKIEASIHVGIAGWGLVDFGLVDDEQDLSRARCQHKLLRSLATLAKRRV
jgi:hypothetical protein